MVCEARQAVDAGLKACAAQEACVTSRTPRAHRAVRQAFGPAIATLVLFLAFTGLHAQAPAITIKLATVVPQGSVWDKNLKQMGDEWSQATGGRVTVTVYPGGSQGDESTVLRKMRLDALQAAAFTAVGLGSIDPAFNVFDIPFFFESYDELNYVTDKLTPVIAQADRGRRASCCSTGDTAAGRRCSRRSRCSRSTI